MVVDGLSLHVTARVGLSEIHDRHQDIAELLDHDQSLYRAKAKISSPRSQRLQLVNPSAAYARSEKEACIVAGLD